MCYNYPRSSDYTSGDACKPVQAKSPRFFYGYYLDVQRRVSADAVKEVTFGLDQ